MTFASFVPILLYAPYALYRQGYDAFCPHEDWGKSRAEITAKGKNFFYFIQYSNNTLDNPAFVSDKSTEQSL